MDEILEEIEYPDSPLSDGKPSDEEDDDYEIEEAANISNERSMSIVRETLQEEDDTDKHTNQQNESCKHLQLSNPSKKLKIQGQFQIREKLQIPEQRDESAEPKRKEENREQMKNQKDKKQHEFSREEILVERIVHIRREPNDQKIVEEQKSLEKKKSCEGRNEDKRESGFEDCERVSHEIIVTDRIANAFLVMNNLYSLLKKQQSIEHQVSEMEREWFFINMNDERTVTSADKIDWIFLNAKLEEVRKEKTQFELLLATHNIDDILDCSYGTADYNRLRNMLDLLFSMEKCNIFLSGERKDLQTKIRRANGDSTEIPEQILKNIQSVPETRSNGIRWRALGTANYDFKQAASSSLDAQEFTPPLKRAKTDRKNSAAMGLVYKDATKKSTEQPKMGRYTSFVACIMQLLRSTSNIKEYLMKNTYALSKTRHQKSHMSAIWNEDSNSSVTLEEAKILIKHLKLEPSTFRQHDAHKFFTFLLNHLHNYLAKPIDLERENLNCPQEIEWRNALGNNKSIISDTFYGQFKISENNCSHCNNSNVKYSVFKSITLPLSNTKSCDLHFRLSLFFKEQTKIVKCPNCGVRGESKRKIDLVKVPPMLIIRLNRFHDDKFERKNNVEVNFPLRCLNMNSYLVYDSNNPQSNSLCKYKLYAMVCHNGQVNGGRYISYCQSQVTNNAPTNIWLQHDDGKCTTSGQSRDPIQTVTSYMLCYSKIIEAPKARKLSKNSARI